MDVFFGCLAAIGIFLIVGGAIWLGFCGVYAIICFCFGLEFSWLIATGIFVIVSALYWLIRSLKAAK